MGTNPLKMMNWNACSIGAKKIELSSFLHEHSIDVGIITETHLKPKNTFSLPGYSTIRLDRTRSNGGGVCIIIKHGIRFFVLPHFATTTIESLGVEIESTSGNIRVIAVYCPRQCKDTDGSSSSFKNDLSMLTRCGTKLVIGGDLNARHEAWRNHTRNRNGCLLFDHAQLGHYTIEFPDDPTFVSAAGVPSTLDVFLANFNISKPVTVNDLSSDHSPVVCEINSRTTPSPARNRKDYNNVNWVAFQRTVDSLVEDNPALNTAEDIDTALETLQRAIDTADERCVRRLPLKGEYLRIDPNTKYLIQVRNSCRRQFQRSGDLSKKRQMHILNKHIRDRLDSLRNANFERVLQGLDNNSKPFWKVCKVLKNKPRPVPPLKLADKLLVTATEKATAIGNHLVHSHELGSTIQSPFEQEVSQCVQQIDNSDCVVPDDQKITVDQISMSLKRAKNMKAPGFDGVFNLVLKNSSNKVLSLLAAIFNRCLELGYFPSCWKAAKIVPILKPGKDPTSPSSYRPISLLSSLSKLFERLILDRLLNHVNSNDVIPPEQFGFRKGHSTVHQLKRVVNNIKHNKSVSKSTAMALMDVEKAFDNVWHDGLVFKLYGFNVPLYITKIIRNYLQDRTFKVSLEGSLSNSFNIAAGVPQGSLLGPILYSIFISDLPPLPDGGVLSLFADDTSIAVKGRTPRELTNKLQRCLNVLIQYLTDWKIKINPAKTQTIMFLYKQSDRLKPPENCKISLENNIIDWSSEVTLLGVVLDAKLLFRSHTEKTKNKCMTLLKCLYPLINRRSKLSLQNKLSVYKQIVAPVIDYAIPVWELCAMTHKKKLQIVQNKYLRLILDASRYTRINDLHELAKIDKICDRIAKHNLKFKEKAQNSNNELIRNLYVV